MPLVASDGSGPGAATAAPSPQMKNSKAPQMVRMLIGMLLVILEEHFMRAMCGTDGRFVAARGPIRANQGSGAICCAAIARSAISCARPFWSLS
jgi:hypothetical protein